MVTRWIAKAGSFLLTGLFSHAGIGRLGNRLACLVLVTGLLTWAPLETASAAAVTVQIEGLEQRALRDNVRGVLRIERASKDPTTRARTIRRLHRRAERDIREALQPFGYYQPMVVSELREEPGDEVRYTAIYRIELGQPTLIEAVDIQIDGPGGDEQAVQAAVAASSLQVGQRLMHTEYTATRNRIKETALSLGYLDADFTQRQMRVNPDEQTADIRLHLTTGNVYRFGDVTIDQAILRPEFLQRYVHINPGQRFDPAKLIELQLRLSDLGYFGSVQVDAQRDAATADNHIPILISTQPLKPQRYEVSAGYGTDTGARTRVLADIRRLNGLGHKLSFDARVSEQENDVTTSYTVPVGSVPGESFSFLLQFEDENLEDGSRDTTRVGVSRNWTLGDWFRSLYSNLIYEDFNIGGEDANTVLLTVGASISRTDISDPVYARSGWSGFLDVHGAVEDVLADTSFVQSRLTLRSVLPGLTPNGRVLLRTDFGANVVGDFTRLPASERFYAGGDESVRGYGYESLSPRDADGNALGGEYLFAGSVEYEQLVWNGLGFAIFGDAGNTAIGEFPDPEYGAGLGLRFRSPVGVIRLDAAYPFADDQDGDVRVHFGIRAGL